ncbi:MAG: hypothetical protein IM631_15805 [Cytophagales bacterium]|nr:hypothetical protein [Cytophagales bacterium]MCA6372837.1 hypothetical protein [Cytophagales bacterium]MCA6374339.1 hypothetical protein [Cytophagales bacterium]MCA6384444.1 hypothetical protein [Cytophagales bacterium]
MKHFFGTVAWVFACFIAFPQEVKKDSIQNVPTDTLITKSRKRVVDIDTYSQRFNPRKAMLYAAVLPGLGQVYNKKYWKVPLVYGGFWALIAVVENYSKQGVRARNDLFDLLDGKTSTANRTLSPTLELTEAQLRTLIDQAQRQRDYFLIFTGFLYILQMVDAHVDAHLKEFDLNPKLKVRIEPHMENSYYTGTSTGIAIKLRF